MKEDIYSVTYPRKVFIRTIMTSLGKVLMNLLTDVKITGQERLPEKGSMILAGNHVAVLEAVMMAVYTPGMVEFIGNGDIPFDPNYAFIANIYGLIPVNRGNLDRKGLKMGVDILKQGGILGIFPEGGTWNPANMQAQIGVAWLSYRAQTPILPIGFGGIKGGLANALKLKHPRLSMNVGEIIPPVALQEPTLPVKANLEVAANKILAEINALIPEEGLRQFRRRVDEEYRLEIKVLDVDHEIELPPNLFIHHDSIYARFLYNPTMMDVLVRNLHLPIKPLKTIDRQTKIKSLLQAWHSILNYLETNPGYFTYRFGVEGGLAMKKSLEELLRLGEWIHQSGYAITIQPIRHYRNANTGADVIERGGCFPRSM
jgi:1-acyl-sn-glycerol-3-phosphate acyltransferase